MNTLWTTVGVVSASLFCFIALATIFGRRLANGLSALAESVRKRPLSGVLLALFAAVFIAYGATKPQPEPESYPVTYEGVAGPCGTNALANVTSYTNSTAAITILPALPYPGYTFKAWTPDNKIPANSTGPKAFTANWEVVTYTIDYDLGDDTATNNPANPATFTVTNGTIKLLAPIRAGYDFTGWSPTDEIPAGSTSNMSFKANWEIHFYNIAYNLGDAAATNSLANPSTYAITNGNIVLEAPGWEGHEFDGWSPDSGVIPEGSTGDRTFTAVWKDIPIPSYQITYEFNGGTNEAAVYPTSYAPTNDTITLAAPTKLGYDFTGWSPTNEIPSGSEGDLCFTANWEVVSYPIAYELAGGVNNPANPASYTIESALITLFDPGREGYEFTGWSPTNEIPAGSTGEKTFNAGWKKSGGDDDVVYEPENVHFKRSLEDLGVAFRDGAIVKSVKAEGLPKGLKLVKDKSSGVYYIEGVATEPLDGEARIAYVRITYADKTQELQPLDVRFAALEAVTFPDGFVGVFYDAVRVNDVFTTNGIDSAWTLKGFPSGLKYDKKTTLAVSGTPKKAGRFTVSATSGKVDGSKYKNTYKATLTVWPDADKVEWTTKAYEPVATNLLDAFGKDIASVSGLPSGLKYDKQTGAVTQFPKKAGTFAVTLKKTDKTTKGFLWTVLPADAPEFALGIPEATPVKDTKFQVVQGSNRSWPITVPAGAKVSAKGLPSGMKLVKDKVTGAYSIQGYPTKAGDYLVTFKTVLNGVTSVTTTAISVNANPFAGSYRGYAIARQTQTKTGPKLVAVTETTMAANGTVKLVYTEGKKKYTATAKGFDWTEDSREATVSNLLLKAERTAVLWFGVEDAPFVELEVFDLSGNKLTDGLCDYGYWVEKAVPAGVGVPLVKSFSFVDALANDFATVSAAYNAKKSTMAFTGALFDGAKVKATVPLCRRGTGELASDYCVAPFLIAGKDGTFYCFNWLDGLDGLEDEPEIFWIDDDGETVLKATPKKGD